MEENADAGAPVAPVAENKQKSGNGLKIATVIACIVAVCGIGFGVYGMMQSSQKDNQISDLKVQIENRDGAITELETEKIQINNSDNTITISDTDASLPQNIRFINDNLSFSDQRYRLMYDMRAEDGQHLLATHERKYYIMDMNSLGSTNSIKEFDLVSILSPIEESEKANELPETSKNALGWVTNKNQCESFYTTYHDPVYRGKIVGETIGIDLSKEIPIEILYHCKKNGGHGEVPFSYTIYLVDVENRTARKFQYQPEDRADFSN